MKTLTYVLSRDAPRRAWTLATRLSMRREEPNVIRERSHGHAESTHFCRAVSSRKRNYDTVVLPGSCLGLEP